MIEVRWVTSRRMEVWINGRVEATFRAHDASGVESLLNTAMLLERVADCLGVEYRRGRR